VRDEDRSPPYNLEAERSVLGACLLDSRAIDEAALVLSRADFFRPEHALAWESILEIRQEGREADGVTLGDHLDALPAFQGGVNDFLAEIVGAVPHAANVAYYAGIVREKALARSVIEACEETLRDCYGKAKTAAEILGALEGRIFELGERESTETTDAMPGVVAGAMDVIVERSHGVPAGVLTGFDDLDDVLCGLRPGTLSILAARPSIGKTAMGMAIAANVGARTGLPVLFVSLEMDREEIGERYLSAAAEINGRSLKDPAHRLDDAAWDRLAKAAGRLCRLPIRVDDAPVRTVAQIASNARRIKRRSGLSLVIVDYLGLIEGERQRGESRQEEVARISKHLRRTAKHLGVPVMALHQLNRQPEARDDRRPRMSDLRESGAIEQDAHVVMLLHRPEFYDPMDRPGMAEVIVAKNRSGATSAVEVAFRKEWTRFESVAGPAPFVADQAAF
jgi:replicative DNA helicase